MSFSVPGVVFKTTDFAELHELLKPWRVRIKKLTREAKAKLYAQIVTTAIDDAAANEKPLPKHPLSAAYDEVRTAERDIKRTGERNPQYDFEFTMALLPFEGKIYGIVYCEQSEWRKKFARLRLTKDFAYWDNTDRPDHVSKKEWEERKRVWWKIFEDSSVPRENGFTVDFTASVGTDPTREEVLAQIAPHKARVARCAANRTRFQRMEMDEVYGAAKASGGANTPIHEYTGAFFRAEKWMKTEQGQCMTALEAGHLTSILPVITKAML